MRYDSFSVLTTVAQSTFRDGESIEAWDLGLKLMNGAKSPARQKPAAAESQSQSVDAARIDRESGGPARDSTVDPQTDVVEFEFAPVAASEVRTKLELARMFLDMGDPATARQLLDEVLEEGDLVIKQEAQRLIDSMP